MTRVPDTRSRVAPQAATPVPHARERGPRAETSTLAFLGNQGAVRRLKSSVALAPGTVEPAAGNQEALRRLKSEYASRSWEARQEREADRIAERAMQTPQPCSCGGTCADCKQEEGLRSPGKPLDPVTRASMEAALGHDLSDVRVHTGSAAARSAQQFHARAFTVGNEVVFAAGEYAPSTSAGRKLLAHELAHVQQQKSGPPLVQRAPDSNEDREEALRQLNAAIKELKQTEEEDKEPEKPARRPRSLRMSPDEMCGGKCFDENAFNRSIRDSNRRLDERIEKDRRKSKVPYSERFNQVLEEMAKMQHKKLEKESPGIRISELSVQSPDEVWSYGMATGQFFESEEKVVREDAEKRARKTFKQRYAHAMNSVGNNWNPGDAHTPAKEVWDFGISNGVFLSSEMAQVLGVRNAYIRKLNDEAEEKAMYARRKAASDREQQFIANFEAVKFQSASLFYAPFLGGGMGTILGSAYEGSQMGLMVGETYNACAHGDAADCFKAAAPLVAAAIVHQKMRAKPEEPIPAGPDPNPIGQQTPQTATLRSVRPDGTFGPPRSHASFGPEPPVPGPLGKLKVREAVNDNATPQEIAEVKSATAGSSNAPISAAKIPPKKPPAAKPPIRNTPPTRTTAPPATAPRTPAVPLTVRAGRMTEAQFRQQVRTDYGVYVYRLVDRDKNVWKWGTTMDPFKRIQGYRAAAEYYEMEVMAGPMARPQSLSLESTEGATLEELGHNIRTNTLGEMKGGADFYGVIENPSLPSSKPIVSIRIPSRD